MKTLTYLCALAFIIIIIVDIKDNWPAGDKQKTTFKKTTQEVTVPPAPPKPEMTESEKKGKELFITVCAACHNKNMVDPMTGPALAGTVQRWNEKGDYEGKSGKEWLYQWIKNSKEVLDAGHPYANQVYGEWNNVMMPPAMVSDEDIDNILAYIQFASEPAS